MNSDSSEARLRAAFQARLTAAPPPDDAVFTRTLAAIDTTPESVATRGAGPAGRTSPARWWNALAAPARFATAALIVIVGGTVAAGTMKAVHDRAAVVEATPATRISLDRWPHGATTVARAATLELAVFDMGAAARDVRAVIRHERGTVVSQSGARGTPRSHSGAPVRDTVHMTVRVPAARFAQTLAAISALGTVRSESETSSDLGPQLTQNARALERAQHDATAAEIAGLRVERARLQARIDDATVAIVLRERSTAMTSAHVQTDELHPARARRTVIALAWGPTRETLGTHGARRRLHALGRVARRAAAHLTRTVRTAT